MSKPTENMAPLEKSRRDIQTKDRQIRGRDDRPKLPPKPQLNIISKFFLDNLNGKYNMQPLLGNGRGHILYRSPSAPRTPTCTHSRCPPFGTSRGC